MTTFSSQFSFERVCTWLERQSGRTNQDIYALTLKSYHEFFERRLCILWQRQHDLVEREKYYHVMTCVRTLGDGSDFVLF